MHLPSEAGGSSGRLLPSAGAAPAGGSASDRYLFDAETAPPPRVGFAGAEIHEFDKNEPAAAVSGDTGGSGLEDRAEGERSAPTSPAEGAVAPESNDFDDRPARHSARMARQEPEADVDRMRDWVYQENFGARTPTWAEVTAKHRELKARLQAASQGRPLVKAISPVDMAAYAGREAASKAASKAAKACCPS